MELYVPQARRPQIAVHDLFPNAGTVRLVPEARRADGSCCTC
jgi:hypothetical protein